jgi:hypothetical protein
MNAHVAWAATPGLGTAATPGRRRAATTGDRTSRDRAAFPVGLGFPDMIDVDPGAHRPTRRTP